jgi:hypothetical protein
MFGLLNGFFAGQGNFDGITVVQTSAPRVAEGEMVNF